GESHGGTRLTLDLLDLDEVTFGNLVLLAAGLDDRVHRRATPFSFTRLERRTPLDMDNFFCVRKRPHGSSSRVSARSRNGLDSGTTDTPLNSDWSRVANHPDK